MKILYVTENKKLVGMQSVAGWTSDEIKSAQISLSYIGREGEISDTGRGVCCICFADLGPREGIPAGIITHGYCPDCYKKEVQKI